MRTPIWNSATEACDRNDNEDAYGMRHGTSTQADGDHPIGFVYDGMGGPASGRVG